jgi:asparagine synthetase B (glutamine-hydrolysing)
MKDEIRVLKRALTATDYLESGSYNIYMKPSISDALALIGHNRHATIGSIRDSNAHPFTDRHITLAHNGHIRNSYALWPGTGSPEVDSMCIPYQMAECGEKEALEKLTGAFALVWFNDTDRTINFARNDDRPLFFAFLEGEKAMVWGSEMYMMHWVLDRNDVNVKHRYLLTAPYHHYKFSLDNPAAYTKVPFVDASKTTQSDLRGRAGSDSTNSRETQGGLGNQTATSGTTTRGRTNTWATDRGSLPVASTTAGDIERFVRYV